MNIMYYNAAKKYLTDNSATVPVDLQGAVLKALKAYLTLKSLTANSIPDAVSIASRKYLLDNGVTAGANASLDDLMYAVAKKYMAVKGQTVDPAAFNTIYAALTYFGINGAGSSSYTGLIATRNRICNAFSTSAFKFGNARTPFWLTTAATSGNWQIVIPGWYHKTTSNLEFGSGATMNVTASIEIAGVSTPLTFSGSATGVMPSAPTAGTTTEQAYLISDAIPLSVAAASDFTTSPSGWVRMHFDAPAGFFYSANDRDATNGACFEFTATDTGGDRTSATGTFTSTGGTLHHVPVFAIIGPTTAKTVGIFGDSRAYGHLDTQTFVDGRKGEVARGIPADVAFINLASYGSTAQNWLAQTSCRSIAYGWFTHLINNLGVNDIFGGRSVNNLQTIDHPGILASPLLTNVTQKWCCTIGPETTSTGNTFESDANQTGKTNSANRTNGVAADGTTGYNDKIVLGTLMGYDNFFDGGRYVQSPTKRSVWLNDGVTANQYVSTDGVHQVPAGYALTATAITDKWSTFYV